MSKYLPRECDDRTTELPIRFLFFRATTDCINTKLIEQNFRLNFPEILITYTVTLKIL